MQYVRLASRSRWLPLRRFILVPSVLIICFFFAGFIPQHMSHAAGSVIWYVAPDGDDTHDCRTPTSACKTIGATVTKAGVGDQIIVATGTYTEHLALHKNLTINGAGAGTTILDGVGSGTVISITSTLSSTTVVTLTGITLRNGQPFGVINQGRLILNASRVSSNNGTGIRNTAFLTLNDVSINANASAGLSNDGAATLDRVTISNNAGNGVSNTGTMTLTNVTISSNQFWGIYNQGMPPPLPPNPPRPPTELWLAHATISGNRHGVFNALGSVRLGAAILANNTDGNCDSYVASNGDNLSSDATCATYFTEPGDRNNIDPKLGPLRDNGGLTLTHGLLPGSPAIDSGMLSACDPPIDQRGVPRPVDGDRDGIARCDSGAYEYNPRLVFLPAIRK